MLLSTDRILAVEAQMESNGEAPQAGFFAGRSTFNEKLEEDFNSGRVSDPKGLFHSQRGLLSDIVFFFQIPKLMSLLQLIRPSITSLSN